MHTIVFIDHFLNQEKSQRMFLASRYWHFFFRLDIGIAILFLVDHNSNLGSNSPKLMISWIKAYLSLYNNQNPGAWIQF